MAWDIGADQYTTGASATDLVPQENYQEQYSDNAALVTGYEDDTLDADLGTELEINNTPPPKAKFVVVHKDRLFYLNCPDEPDGGTLVRWSKVGIGDSCPSVNYQYFDRRDGEDITGAASIGDYLFVFKRNKIYVLKGDFQVLYAVQRGVGCIASWAIVPFEDKVVFLSEEGWRAFDGENMYDLSRSLRPLAEMGYVSIGLNNYYSAVYYPAKDQFLYLCSHPTKTKKAFVGHFLVPLLYVNKGIPEQLSHNIVGWTYYEYPTIALTCFASYTDSAGIQRVIAGGANGYVYLADSGDTDDGNDIPFSIKTGWQTMGTPPSVSKTLRLAYLSLSMSGDMIMTLQVEKDYESPFFSTNLDWIGTGFSYCGYAYCGYSYCGAREGSTERVAIPGTPGQLFRFGLSGSGATGFNIQALTFQYRVAGVR